jgi:small redox-active disulfide protein 1
MEQSKIEVFTSPTCPHCPSAKQLAQEVSKGRDDVRVIEQSTATAEGVKKAQHYNIMTVPTILVTGPATNEVFGFQGTPSRTKLVEAIEMSLGKREIPNNEPKKGFFARVFGN